MGGTLSPRVPLAAVALAVPVVWSHACLLHEPGGEISIALPDPGDEVPARAIAIRDALTQAGAPLAPAERHADAPLLAVHDEASSTTCARRGSAGGRRATTSTPGRRGSCPTSFRTPACSLIASPRRRLRCPARAGLSAYDTMTPIGRETWTAARAAVDVVLSAADLVLGGARLAYACTRPPGHDATRTASAAAAT